MAPETIKEALIIVLANLTEKDFKMFCTKLVDRRKEPRVWRNKVENKDHMDVADVLVSTFTEQVARDVAVEILKAIGCSNEADDLVEATRGLSSKSGSSGTSERERESPSPQDRTQQDNKSYKMDALPCGYCLIINNVKFEQQTKLKERTGSNVDCDKLGDRFKAFNFIVEERTNLKQEQIKDELSQLSKKDHSQYDCCVVIILSHGNKVGHKYFPGAVYGVDGQLVPVESITNYLQHCPSLQGKPKLFFIQACGGGEADEGCMVSSDGTEPSTGGADNEIENIPASSSGDSPSMSTEPDTGVMPPNLNDILVSYSTFPGYVSWRDHRSGSLYVEALDNILKEYAATVDLATMLTKVNDKVSQNCIPGTYKEKEGTYKQMPGYSHYLCKSLYFQTKE